LSERTECHCFGCETGDRLRGQIVKERKKERKRERETERERERERERGREIERGRKGDMEGRGRHVCEYVSTNDSVLNVMQLFVHNRIAVIPANDHNHFFEKNTCKALILLLPSECPCFFFGAGEISPCFPLPF
jgi:hypothetical protein